MPRYCRLWCGRNDRLGGESSSDEREALSSAPRAISPARTPASPDAFTSLCHFLAKHQQYTHYLIEERYTLLRTPQVDNHEHNHWSQEALEGLISSTYANFRQVQEAVQTPIRRGVPDEYKKYVIHLAIGPDDQIEALFKELEVRVFGQQVPTIFEGDLPTFTYGFAGAEKELHQKPKHLDFDVVLGRLKHRTSFQRTTSQHEHRRSTSKQMDGPRLSILRIQRQDSDPALCHGSAVAAADDCHRAGSVSKFEAMRRRGTNINITPMNSANVRSFNDLQLNRICSADRLAAGEPHMTQSASRPFLSMLSMGSGEFRSDANVPLHSLEATTPYAAVLSEEGQNAAKKILWMISSYYPQLEFAPVLVPLVCILLYYVGESETLVLLVRILDKSAELMKKNDTTRAFMTLRRSEFVRLVKQAVGISEAKLKTLTQHLDELGVDLAGWLARGLQDGFSRLVPFDLLVRMYISFLFDGVKVFLRYAIAMLLLVEDELLETESAEEAHRVLLFRNLRTCDPEVLEELTKLAFKTRIRSRMMPINAYTSADAPTPYLEKTDVPQFFRPRLDQVSGVLTDEMWTRVWRWVPNRYRILDPIMRFTTAQHGCSVSALIRALWPYVDSPMIAVIKSTHKDVLVLSAPVAFRPDFKNIMSELDVSNAFVARLTPRRTPRVYYHSGERKRVMVVHEDIFFGDPQVLHLDNELLHGQFHAEEEVGFHCPNLVADPYGDFRVAVLEVWTLE